MLGRRASGPAGDAHARDRGFCVSGGTRSCLPGPRAACSDDEDEACVVCGAVDKAGVDMIECDRCLRGFHLDCLKPVLPAVPEVRLAVLCPDRRACPGA